MKVIKPWQEYFNLPFKLEHWGMYVFDNHGQMVLMFSDDLEDNFLKSCIIHGINTGEIHDKIKGKKFTCENEDIFMDAEYLMCCRGWGYLTGLGSCALSNNEASNIQDAMIEYLLNQINHG